MPYESKKQQAWAHTPSGMKALGGAAKVHEWDEATKRKPGGFAALPKRVPKRAGDAPGANLMMRPAVAPAAIKPVRPVARMPFRFARPKGVKGIAPAMPKGSRSMSSGSNKGFGSFMPNAFDGEPNENF